MSWLSPEKLDGWLRHFVDLFELDGPQAAESRVSPLPIVKHFNILKDIGFRLLFHQKVFKNNQLSIHGCKERPPAP